MSRRALVVVATLLTLGVVSLGAYVRLADAGLGCPDWPGCYGHLIGVPDDPAETAQAAHAFPGKPVEVPKAWTEMVHRYFAGTLGLLILAITALAWRRRWRDGTPAWLETTLLVVVIGQALLGMLTVTQLLKPMVVTAHLLGGMTTLALLALLARRDGSPPPGNAGSLLRGLAALALLVVVVQIALGGWVSSNYAALACPDFPTCRGAWMPEMDVTHAFQIRRELGHTAGGTLLSNEALVAIHWAHRLGALVVTAVVGALAIALLARREWRAWGGVVAAALVVQVTLGVANVLLSLPLAIAVAHNTGAAVLLVVLVVLNARIRNSRATIGPV